MTFRFLSVKVTFRFSLMTKDSTSRNDLHEINTWIIIQEKKMHKQFKIKRLFAKISVNVLCIHKYTFTARQCVVF